jgi:uncharacterized protein
MAKIPLEQARYSNLAFEWDENKRRSNIDKHGIDFDNAREVFRDQNAYTMASPRSENEQRHVTVGAARNVMIAVIFTMRGPVIRIISARAARSSEKKRYDPKIQKPE